MDEEHRDLSIVAIIALYNGEEFIERSLSTILAQSRPADEILIIDDGSTDNGPAIVERMIADHPYAQLLRKENGGQSSARNFGVQHSRSNLIALLDQDDGWYPDHLEKLIIPFQTGGYRKLGWVYSDLDHCDRFGQLHTHCMLRHAPQTHPKEMLTRCLAEDMFVLPSASLISREAFEAVGRFDERLSGYEDDDLFLRLFHAGWQNVFLPEALSFWCIYPGSTSFSPRMIRSRMIYFDKLRDTFAADPSFNFDPMQHLIVPRFLQHFLPDIERAERTNNTEALDSLIRNVRHILKHLRWGRMRLRYEAYLFIKATPFVRDLISTRIGRAAWSVIRGRA